MTTLANTHEEKALLSPKEVYEAFGGAIGYNAVYELVRSGRIKSIRLGRKILVPRSELEDWLEREAGEAR
jgi:excisionase family DNA binding protein